MPECLPLSFAKKMSWYLADMGILLPFGIIIKAACARENLLNKSKFTIKELWQRTYRVFCRAFSNTLIDMLAVKGSGMLLQITIQ